MSKLLISFGVKSLLITFSCMNLVIINVALDDKDSIFAHQIKVAESLSNHFASTTVITRRNKVTHDSNPMKIVTLDWAQGQKIHNAFQLLVTFIRIAIKLRNFVVFTHMSETMAALVAPITFIFRKKHFLWYAHKSNPLALRFASRLISGVITSTNGSCPIKGPKVHVIGQGVDCRVFSGSNNMTYEQLKHFFYFGRLDESKDIPSVIRSTKLVLKKEPEVKLLLIGNPSRLGGEYEKELREIVESRDYSSWLARIPSIQRDSIPSQLQDKGIFVHASEGSLDKTLIEATMLWRPVATCNFEYLREFGFWSTDIKSPLRKEEFLAGEIEAILDLPLMKLKEELERRRLIAVRNHSLDGWINRIVSILTSEKK